MGSCLSKKSVCASSSSSPVALQKPPEKLQSDSQLEKKEAVVKKEIFVIKHRISHEIERPRSDDENGDLKNFEGKIGEGLDVGAVGNGGGGGGGGGGAAPVRTSSCTKEEVDAILIQCGRLSRSSSTGKAGPLSSENGGRKYSGSKRSYDFDNDNGRSDGNNVVEGDDDAVARERENRRRERHRQSQGRRRTPSREREKDQAAQQQRSGSRERVPGGGSGGGGRRVSRSPGRRSESPITANSNSSSANTNSRPGKMVSVPATVSSMAMDKSTNAGGGGEPNSGAAIKRIQVKRNVGGDGAAVGTTRTVSSPRARSPANVRVLNENSNQNQPISLSRSNSRKAEHSPYRRNPLGEIDTNIIPSQAPPIPKANGDKNIVQGAENRINQQQQHLVTEETKGQYGISGHVGLNVISSVGPGDNPKLNAVARTRSSRLSRDLDINPETLSNPNAPPSSSYTALLLEDIQNFHQKNTTPSPPPPSFSLPECLTKACSILEAVADLNSSTGENKSSLAVRKTVKMDPTIVESEVVVNDDLMEPSFHKYVTVKRGGTMGVREEDLEEQESSGSNSIVGSQQQQWLSSSGWEPNSAESTDRWTCSSSASASASASSSGKRVVSAKKRNSQHSGIGRGRIGTGGGSTLQDNVVFRV